MEKELLEGQVRLVNEVIRKGICVRCGACVGLCPYFQYHDGKVVVADRCEAGTWRCIQICPRIPYDRASLYEHFYQIKEQPQVLGPYKRIIAARSAEMQIRDVAQYGGVVTALILFAIENGMINWAVLTDRGESLAPRGLLCNSREQIIACSGSRYTASAALQEVNLAIKSGKQGIGFVGLPCQMEALSRLALSEPEGRERFSSIALRVGIFCTWALDWRRLRSYLEAKGLTGIAKKYDIPPPPSEIFVVETQDAKMELPLSEIRKIIQPGCKFCEDMTAEFADISVGTLVGEEGWNTVILRTDKGVELFDRAVQAGMLEEKQLPASNLDHLKEAASNKRKKALQAREEGEDG